MQLTAASRVSALIVAIAACVLCCSSPASAQPPTVEAAAAVLVDTATGVVLFDRAMHERRPMASTTKIMTALVALESSQPDDLVTIPETVTEADGSSLCLTPGERLTMHDLLAGLLIGSANDAAVAVAVHIGGSVEAFAESMNQRAQDLGATDTHFVNPHGLYARDHYSTASDLALLTRAAMNQPLFRELVATKVADISRQSPDGPTRVINHNKLLWRADFVDGVKTGYVNQSGHCLVASGTREDWQLIAVVLDSPDMYADTLALLEYGFSTYSQRIHARAGDALGRAPVRRGKSGSVPAVCEWTLSTVTGPGHPDAARLETALNVVEAPIAAGDPVGEAHLVLDGVTVARTPLLASQPVPRTRFSATTIWVVRALAFFSLAFLMVRTHAKIVKANRRRRGGLPPQGR